MTNNTKSTLAGLIIACVLAGATYMQTGFDPSSPASWAGLVGSIASAVTGYYHNQPKADPPSTPEA
ncbi:MAG: hypothetical protein JFAIHJKO_02775 [Pyrinomonadaceae bacterium]|nr:hypothetical protein [Pyrinomonadaceae bacterium]